MKLLKKLSARKDKNNKWQSYAVFWCDFCFSEVEKKTGDGGKCKSCGCVQYLQNKTGYKHGGKGTILYNIWKGIKSRCLNSKSKSYKYYGGRGIKVCDEWLEFIPFRDWAVSNGYVEGLQIHRENDGNYEPYSCRWVTKTENLRYTRKTTTLEIANEIRVLYKTGKYTQQELADRFNIKRSTVSHITNNKIWKS